MTLILAELYVYVSAKKIMLASEKENLSTLAKRIYVLLLSVKGEIFSRD